MKSLQIIFFVLVFTLSLSAQDYSKPLITTIGEAVVYADPDEVRMTLSIKTTGANISETKANNNKLSAEAIKYLKTQGVDSKHIQTQYLQVSKLDRRIMVNEVIQNYRAFQSIHICIKDVIKYASIVDGLLEIGVTNIGSPQFRNTNIGIYKDDARRKAIKNAQKKAIRMVDAIDQRIKHAYQIKEIDLGWSQNSLGYTSGRNHESIEAEGELSFAPGQLEVIAKVEVAFVLLHE